MAAPLLLFLFVSLVFLGVLAAATLEVCLYLLREERKARRERRYETAQTTLPPLDTLEELRAFCGNLPSEAYTYTREGSTDAQPFYVPPDREYVWTTEP